MLSSKFAYLYGVKVHVNDELRSVFKDMANPDIYGIKDYVENGLIDDLPEGEEVFTKSPRLEILYGPGSAAYIGYEVVPPYAQLTASKEELDKNIHEVLEYLYGKEYADSHNKPRMICEVWTE